MSRQALGSIANRFQIRVLPLYAAVCIAQMDFRVNSATACPTFRGAPGMRGSWRIQTGAVTRSATNETDDTTTLFVEKFLCLITPYAR